MISNNIKAEPIRQETPYGKVERFIIVNIETGEVLDDAQGYGYKTAVNAYKAYGYKAKRPEKFLNK